VKKNKWIGQEQTYFHLKLIAPRSAVTIDTAEPEFRDTQWIEPAEFKLRWLPPEKHPVYRQVLQDFFQVDVAIAAEVP
jgi:putative (di)nucleoside polyphosphate hydrolase